MSCHDHPWRRAFATCAASRVSARRRNAEAAFSPTRGSAPLAVEARSAVVVIRQEYLTITIRQGILTRPCPRLRRDSRPPQRVAGSGTGAIAVDRSCRMAGSQSAPEPYARVVTWLD